MLAIQSNGYSCHFVENDARLTSSSRLVQYVEIEGKKDGSRYESSSLIDDFNLRSIVILLIAAIQFINILLR